MTASQFSEVTSEGKTYYVFSLPGIAPNQMNDTVKLTLHAVKDGKEYVSAPTEYSAAEYCYSMLKKTDDAELRTLLVNLLDYGAAAQHYTGYKTGDLANKGYELTEFATVPDSAENVTVEGAVAGISFYGASLLHQNKLSVRFYFAADSIDGLTFKVGETESAPVAKDGKYYVDVAEIDPQEIADKITVNVSNGSETLSVSYAALDYIIRMYNKADSTDSTKALVQALYGYYLAAVDYLA